MSNKKKTKRIKILPKQVRLERGKNWLAERRQYYLKKLASDYHKTYHVDLVTAYEELKELGVPYDDETIEAIRQKEQKKIVRQQKKEARNREDTDDDPEAYGEFAYIAGYTSGGMPFGILRDADTEEEPELDLDPDDLPF